MAIYPSFLTGKSPNFGERLHDAPVRYDLDTTDPTLAGFVPQRPGRPVAPSPLMDEDLPRPRADAGEAWCGSESPCDSVPRSLWNR